MIVGMITRLSVCGPADIIALIPQLIDSEPRQSVVLIAQRGRLQNAVLRVDLPHDESVTTNKRFATTVVGMLCKIPDIESVIVAVYSDRPADDALPHEGFMDILLRRIHQSGIHITEAVCRAENAWGSYLDDEHQRLRSLAELEPASAGMFVRERESPVAVTAGQRDAVRSRVAELSAELASLRHGCDHDERDEREECDCNGESPELDALLDLPTFFEEALSWDEPTLIAKAAILILSLQGPPARDAAMLQWAFSLEVGYVAEAEAYRFFKEGLDEDAPAAVLLADLLMGHGPSPETARVQRALRLIETLVVLAEESQRPPLLCMLAWLNWARGRGSLCADYIEQTVEIDPGYGMAEVLHALTRHGMLPDWLFLRPEEKGFA